MVGVISFEVRASIEKILRALEGVPGIAAVYLFGSSARGDAHPGSDLDIALVPEHGASLPSVLDLQCRIVAEGVDNCDLAILEHDNVVFAHEVVKHNKLLFKADRFNDAEFFLRAKKRYLDLEPLLKVQREALKERIVGG